MIQVVNAKKEYTCNITNKKIKVGEKYKRVNIKNLGIFHFKLHLSNAEVELFVENRITDKDLEEAWSEMPEEF